LPKDKKPENDRARKGPQVWELPVEIFYTTAYSNPWNGCSTMKSVNSIKSNGVLKKVENEEIEFEHHSTFMSCAHGRSPETGLWRTGFLNKGFHWPVAWRHAHTDILLLAIP
jgi:hypothetical protein